LAEANLLDTNQTALAQALLNMCIQGLNPGKNQCYFINYGGKVTMMRSYFGDRTVLLNYGLVKDVQANIIYEGDEVTYYTYSESEARFSKPHITTDCGGDCISSSDNMLIPLFDDIFTQPASEAIIYTHYSLHDITKANVVSDLPDESTGEWKVIQDNYRYNRPDKKLMVEITDQERGTFCFSETYDIYNESYQRYEQIRQKYFS
jgi:hypothetical protein